MAWATLSPTANRVLTRSKTSIKEVLRPHKLEVFYITTRNANLTLMLVSVTVNASL